MVGIITLPQISSPERADLRQISDFKIIKKAKSIIKISPKILTAFFKISPMNYFIIFIIALLQG